MKAQQTVETSTTRIRRIDDRFMPAHTICPLAARTVGVGLLESDFESDCDGRCHVCPVWLLRFYGRGRLNLLGERLVA
jgi:hypothetical protein